MNNENPIKFIPVRGSENKIQKADIKDGYIYFATDSGKIYVDSQGKRSTMGAAGAAIYYGTEDSPTEDKDTGHFLISIEAVEDKSVKRGDLILNSDGGFYKVESVDLTNYVCSLLSVSGTGGGPAKTRPEISFSIGTTNLINGQSATFTIWGKSARTADGTKFIDSDLSVIYSLGEQITDTVVNNYKTVTIDYHVGDSGELEDEIDFGSYLRENTTTVLSVYIKGRNHDEISYIRSAIITTSAMQLKRAPGFNPTTRYEANTKLHIDCNVLGPLPKILDFYYDDMTKIKETKYIDSTIANSLQSFSIATNEATHGAHKIKIELFQDIGQGGNHKRGLKVPSLEYEIAVVDSVDPNAKPVIWFGDYKNEYYNYDTIQIPYLVWDPADTNTATVHLYRNNIELLSSPRDITVFNEFALWEIADAEMGSINSYQISCGETDDRRTMREISFKVVQDPNRNMIVSQTGLAFDFSAIGRSNTESPAKRAMWEYEIDGVKKSLQFKDFNWYNNGWILDNATNTPNCKDVTNTSCLRISNGAQLTVPFKSLVFGSGVSGQISHTVEMQLRIRNIQKYENLITNVTRYKVSPSSGLSYDDNATYEKFKEQMLTGYDNYDAYLQATLSPEIYEALEFDYVEKNVNINNIVAGLYDYNSGSGRAVGFCVGTQDAFFSNGENTVNVDFVENELINLSFVYQHDLKYLYIYINGVISGVIKSTKDSSFSISNTDFIFNSKYCDIDLFKIRVYNTYLDVNQVITNFAVDRKDVDTFDQSNMYSLAVENDNLHEYQFIYDRMLAYNREHPNDPIMPYIIYDTGNETLPFSKERTKNIKVEFVNTPLEVAYENGELEELARLDGLIKDGETDGQKIQEGVKTYYKHHCPSWTSTMLNTDRVEFSVQGTSSEFYPRRNYKIKTKMDFENCWNEEEQKYEEEDNLNIFLNRGPFAEIYVNDKNKLAEDSKYLGHEESRMSDGWYMNNYTNPTDRWTMKVDFMESSGSYNAGFASMVGNAYTKHPLQDYLDVMNGTDNLKPKVVSSVLSNIQWNDYRTSLLGFPVLAFQKTGSGENVKYTFLGIYRMLLDKGSSEVLGFKTPKKLTSKLFTKEGKNGIEQKPMREIAECWEFSNNARGFCSFRDPWNRVELSFKAPSGASNAYTAFGAPIVANSFEYRYHDAKDDIDVLYKFNDATQEELNEVAKNLGLSEGSIVEDNKESGADALLTTHRNWEKVCKWVWSTNVDAVVSQGVYNPILVSNTVYEKNKYFIIDSTGTSETGFVLADQDFDETIDYYRTKVIIDPITQQEQIIYVTIRLCSEENKFAENKYYYQVSGQNTTDPTDDVYALADTYDDSTDYYTFTSYTEEELNKKFDLLVRPVDVSKESFSSSVTYYKYDGTKSVSKGSPTGAVSVVENPNETDFLSGKYYIANKVTYAGKEYTHDSREYRAAKFSNEFNKHFDPEYTATYFVMSEVMELYDSRGKNCMMASWGPHSKDGDYIWYPIFYDIDTQLGINNTGIPSFKFNVDATEAGNFSTSDSILWNNFYKFFKNKWMLPKYRNLRGNDSKFAQLLNKDSELIAPLQSVDYIEKWYNFDPVTHNNIACRGKRPLLAKNLDMYFKYITICNEKAKEEGVAHLGGADSGGAFADPDSGTYFYALQGDRSQSRRQFIDSRLDYIDSWLVQGNYVRGGSNRLWGRISANNRSDLNSNLIDVHSDKWTDTVEDPYWVDNIEFGTKTHEFDAEYWIEPKPIRSSYVTAGDDSMNYPSQKYDGVNKLNFVLYELENGIRTSNNYPEQLLYLYGTNQMSSFGDLSKMYWTEFKLEGKADKLTELKLGHDGKTFDYINGSATEKSEISWYNNKLNGITLPTLPLLKEINLCNIGLINETALDLSKSEKLENFRATGSSNITSVKFADGVALNTLYLPASVSSLSLTQAQLLTDLIGQDSAHPYAVPVLNTNTDKLEAKRGLYLERFFDGSSSLSNIKFVDGALGYNSYTILKRLYDIYQGTDNNAYTTMLNVQWCPYTQLVEGDKYNNKKTYYIDNGHYGFELYTNVGASYNETKFNIDILSGKLYVDNGHGGRNYSYEPISLTANNYEANLYYVKNEQDEYVLATQNNFDATIDYYVQIDNGFSDLVLSIDDNAITMLTNLYRNSNFKDSSETTNPQISGVIYINNNTSIEESKISTELQKWYPNLTFFFKNVTPAYSATFVIVDKDTGAEKYVEHRISGNYGPTVQKIKAENIDFEYFENPYELYKIEKDHWVFYGWSTTNDLTGLIYGNITDDMTEEEKIAAHAEAWNAKKSEIIKSDKYSYTFYAILKEKEYAAIFKDTFDSSYEEISYTAYSDKGSYMSDDVIPPANYSNTNTYMRNAFKGWSLDPDVAKIIYSSDKDVADLPIVNVGDYPATRDYTFYAIYQEESVFKEVLDINKYFEVRSGTGEFLDPDETYKVQYSNGYELTLKAEYKSHLKGKITLPTRHPDGKPIYIYSGFSSMPNITHVFFDETYPCEIREISGSLFRQSMNLEFVDFAAMPKLRAIRSYAFQNCRNFKSFNFYNPLRVIEEQAFATAGQQTEKIKLRLNSELTEIGIRAFNNGAHFEIVIFGDKNNPSKLTQNNNTMNASKSQYIINNQSGYRTKYVIVYTDPANAQQWNDWLEGAEAPGGYYYGFILKEATGGQNWINPTDEEVKDYI